MTRPRTWTDQEQLREQALVIAHSQARPAAKDVSVMKRHPIEIGVDAALQVSWAEIERLREEVLQLKQEVNNHVGVRGPTPYPEVDEIRQQQADMARGDWLEGH